MTRYHPSNVSWVNKVAGSRVWARSELGGAYHANLQRQSKKIELHMFITAGRELYVYFYFRTIGRQTKTQAERE